MGENMCHLDRATDLIKQSIILWTGCIGTDSVQSSRRRWNSAHLAHHESTDEISTKTTKALQNESRTSARRGKGSFYDRPVL